MKFEEYITSRIISMSGAPHDGVKEAVIDIVVDLVKLGRIKTKGDVVLAIEAGLMFLTQSDIEVIQ